MTDGVPGPSWTSDGREVLERACAHYGGRETWRALRRIRLVPEKLSGLVPWLKGVGQTFPLPKLVEVSPHDRKTTFIGYPEPGLCGVFENGAVCIQSADGASVVEKSDAHRATFRGLAKYRRWAPIDALYFFGYALWHYHSLPFTLGAARLLAASRSRGLSVLAVELPSDVPTHCRRQTFFFDERGQLTRHDYHAEIIGAWAHGAHFWNRQRLVNGFPIALERHVVARLGSTPCPVTALHATFGDAEVELSK